MKKKLLLLPILLLTGALAVSCSASSSIMSKPSGFSFRGEGNYNSLSDPMLVDSFDEFTYECTRLIASEYNRFFIKLNFRQAQGKTVGEIFNCIEIDAHLSSLEIEFYDRYGEIMPDVNAYTQLQQYWTLEVIVHYSYPLAASHHTKEKLANKKYGEISGNLLLRQSKYEARSEDFDEFPIDSRTRAFNVHNSEELWWACENGFLPTFENTNSRAYALYEEARGICREYIRDGMTDFEKIMTIYEYITSNIEYDYDCLDDSVAWQQNTAYYLEGPFAYQRGVCDSFSKMFSLLAGIEDLDVIRGFGYNYEQGVVNSGHAWNYASIDGGTDWYLLCTTWGRIEGRLEETSKNVFMSTYNVAFTSANYFKDHSDYDFKEDIWSGHNKMKSRLDVADLDTYIYNGVEYDFKLDSYEELEATINKIHEMGITDVYSLNFTNGSMDFQKILNTPKGPQEHTLKTRFKAKLAEYGYDSYYMFDEKDNVYDPHSFTILIGKM